VDASDDLSTEAIERAFAGDPERLRQFVTELGAALPPGTTIALRGSAVAGTSFKTGAPFDALGPRTSDLDIVLVGESVVDFWVPDAQVLGGINTLPLSDDADWVAPALDRARRRAQAIVGRPVSLQAMAGWFLELRTQAQGQPHVVLSEGS
jgi:hypothetical protein